MTLKRDRFGAELEEAADLIEEYDAIEAIVGLPRRMNGGSSASTEDARRWAHELAQLVTSVSVRLVDERLSTVTAHRELHESGRTEASFRKVVDQAAAVVILDQALDTERMTNAPAGELVPPIRRDR
jgi:RNAse H domain protein, YqgF family